MEGGIEAHPQALRAAFPVSILCATARNRADCLDTHGLLPWCWMETQGHACLCTPEWAKLVLF